MEHVVAFYNGKNVMFPLFVFVKYNFIEPVISILFCMLYLEKSVP